MSLQLNDVLEGRNVDGEIYDIDIKRYFGNLPRDKRLELRKKLKGLYENQRHRKVA